MAKVTFRFVEPISWVGELICWRLSEPWSHVVVVFDDCAYSAQIPRVAKLPLDHRVVAMPPRTGKDVIVEVSDAEYEKMRLWCEGQVGRFYDFASIMGWFLGWHWLQWRANTYCFEFVAECLDHMGWLARGRRLIKGNRLILDIERLIITRVDRPGMDQSTYEVVNRS